MRKRIIGSEPPASAAPDPAWLDVGRLAQVEISSEEHDYPIEAALLPGGPDGWRAAAPGAQTIRLLFDEPQHVRRLRVAFHEQHRPRTQEFVLRWSADGGHTYREVVRQQYTFSPPDTTREVEDYAVSLDGVTTVELQITPDIGGGDARASLAALRIAEAA